MAAHLSLSSPSSSLYTATMPPMAFTGLVTKVGFMNKTATVTVSRFVTHPKVGKVYHASLYLS